MHVNTALHHAMQVSWSPVLEVKLPDGEGEDETEEDRPGDVSSNDSTKEIVLESEVTF